MKILTVDVGTGTQDIYLYDSNLDLENGLKLIVPSPTMIVRRQIQTATLRKEALLLTGVTMGGGPNSWAAEDHLRAGLPIYATPEAARSFNDDLEKVHQMGVEILSEDESLRLPETVRRIKMLDFDFASIMRAFESFGVNLDDLAAVAVAVFDHGNAPPDVSDRKFRFDYLDERIRAENRLSAFAYLANNIPFIMTRLQAVATSAAYSALRTFRDVPLVVMDTAPAAVLGATFDTAVRRHARTMVVNIGNFHTLAFRLGSNGIEGVFEHHTGFLNQRKLEDLLRRFAEGVLTRQEIFDDHGHGALVYSSDPLPLDDNDNRVVITGPRRSLMIGSNLQPYFAVPFGDMMISGCFGLLAAVADVIPELAVPIKASLYGNAASKAPWDV